MQSMLDAISAALSGHRPSSIIDDGRIHRFSTSKKSGDKAGWYVSHGDFGHFGCHRACLQSFWSRDGGELTVAQKQRIEKDTELIQKERDERHARAVTVAQAIWDKAQDDASGHSYLKAKGIPAYHCKLITEKAARAISKDLSESLRGDLLVIPMRVGKTLTSLQFIAGDSTKRPLSGGKKQGSYHLIGNRDDSQYIAICEGFATGVSIHEATGMPVAIAFDANNIVCVADHFLDKIIIVCADNDSNGTGLNAAKKVKGAIIAMPADADTDFNDVRDPARINAIIQAAIKGRENADPFPDIDQLPGWVVLDDLTKYAIVEQDVDHGLYKGNRKAWALPGVYWCFIPKGKNMLPEYKRICGALHVDAITADPSEDNSGRVLRFKTMSGSWRQWSMAAGLYLTANGDLLCQSLRERNLDVDTQSHPLVSKYIQQATPGQRLVAAPYTGWYGKAYATDGGIYGPDAYKTVLQTAGGGLKPRFGKAGTLIGWRDTVAAMASGNQLMVLAISAAFAGTILKRCGATGGGIHFFGNSSTGKTKLLSAACSVWGDERFRWSWRMTQNGLETACTESNDCLLALDEISEHDSRELRGSIYMIGNGEGKRRMTRDGRPLPQKTWRTMVLSSGERSSTTACSTDKHAGQMIRLIDMWVNREHGAFDNLNRYDSGAEFADAISQATERNYGTAGPAFVEAFIDDPVDCMGWLEQINIGDTSTGQAGRIAKTLKIIAMAGELASKYNIVPWEQGWATAAATEALEVWSDYHDTSDDVEVETASIEESELIKQVERYIRQHEQSRFTKREQGPGELFASVQNHAGWYDIDYDGSKIYYLNSFGFTEAIKGFDRKPAIKQLIDRKILDPGSDRTVSVIKIYGKPTRVYKITI